MTNLYYFSSFDGVVIKWVLHPIKTATGKMGIIVTGEDVPITSAKS